MEINKFFFCLFCTAVLLTKSAYANESSELDCRYSADLVVSTTPLIQEIAGKFKNRISYQDYTKWRVGVLQPQLEELESKYHKSPYPYQNLNYPVYMNVVSDYLGRVRLLSQSVYTTLRYGESRKESVKTQWVAIKKSGEDFTKSCPDILK